MSRDINTVILEGNLGADPEMRTIPSSGTAVANLSIATNEAWKDKQTGEQKEHTEWHRVVLFAHLAEFARKRLHKGSRVLIRGRLKTRKWEKDGQKHSTTEIISSNPDDIVIIFSGNKDTGWEPNQSAHFASQTISRPTTTPSQSSSETSESFDDDVPF